MLPPSSPALTDDEAKKRFRKGLFDPSVLQKYTAEYAESSPYKHSVIHGLIDDKLLRSVRDEIRNNVSFTPKETDIYKIHQSGDLANLDGLDDEALSKLPSLLALRDAMYSEAFRDYVSHITGSGPLSGRKTDMAINVYTPGCFLLCHDDVIGSRKVSYILYLTDPDTPWQSEWGGALRLFPVTERKGDDGQVAKTPSPDVVKAIPPAWNQLSFFAVQPGESFHDVEEVYHAESEAQLKEQGGRVRMAISGWFHIPQIGEDGYVEGAEEAQLKNSSLMQLQGNPDQHDQPQPQIVEVQKPSSQSSQGTDESQDFSQSDFDFLLKYLSPTYLTPDTLQGITDHFEENSSIILSSLLNTAFAKRLREYITEQEAAALPEDSADIEEKTPWKVARPPHKHRFLYRYRGSAAETSPLQELLETFLPSRQFRQWLEIATSTSIESSDLVARRFRRGRDYTLATEHNDKSRLELNLGLTPTPGWGDDPDESDESDEEGGEEEEDEEDQNGDGGKQAANDKDKGKGKRVEKAKKSDEANEADETQDVGGVEVYMAGDEDGNEDAAIYTSSNSDDNILFFQAASWNKMTIVMRDSGTLRFVKYVSRRAPGDRWDVSGTFEIEDEDEEEDPDEANTLLLESSEEEFNGFPSSSDDSDSD